MCSRFSQLACSVAFLTLVLIAPVSMAQQRSVAPSEPSNPAAQEAEREVTQPLNNAPVWREVRSGVPAITAVTSQETNVLIQPTMRLPFEPAVSAGEAWRLARPPLSTVGGT